MVVELTNALARKKEASRTSLDVSHTNDTSDIDKPVSTAQAAAIAAKKDEIVGGAPTPLNSLNKIATALGNDPNFAATVTALIGTRVRFDAAQTLSSPQRAQAKANLGLDKVANLYPDEMPVSVDQRTALENRLRIDADQGLTNPQKTQARANIDLDQVANLSPDEMPVSLAQQAEFENRLRVDAEQGLAAPQRLQAKINLGVERVDNTSDAEKVVEGPIADSLNVNAAAISLETATSTEKTGVLDPRDEERSRIVVGIVDQNNRAAGIGSDGKVYGGGVEIRDSAERDDVAPVETIVGLNGQQLIAIDESGRLIMPKITLLKEIVVAGDERDQTSKYTSIISAIKAGKEYILFGIDEAGNPAVPGLSNLPQWINPVVMRGSYGAMNVRYGTNYTYGTVQTRQGIMTDVRQRSDRTVVNTAIALGILRALLVYGQSNAGPSPEQSLLISKADWIHHIETFEGQSLLYGTGLATTPPSKMDLVPPSEIAGTGQSPQLMVLTALADLEASKNFKVTPRACVTSWEGAQPAESFYPAASGHYNYENAVQGLQALLRVAVPYEGAQFTDVLWIQGENPSTDYVASLGALIDTVLPAMNTAVQTGKPVPHFYFRQINIGRDDTSMAANHSALPQLAVARTRLGAGVTLTGPMYQAPMSAPISGGDSGNIHSSNIGRMITGEQDAYAMLQREAGLAWHPLWPVAGGVTRSGVTVTIPMSLPPGLPQTSKGLLLDTDWVLPVANSGFVYADNAATGIAITNVAISGTNIVLTLSGNPGSAAGQRIEYACFNHTGDTGWSAGRGQLFADSGIDSPYFKRGFAVPPKIRLYCVRFRETIN